MITGVLMNCGQSAGEAGEIPGKKNAPNQSGRQMNGAAVNFLFDPQRPFVQVRPISGTVLLQSNRSAR